MPVDFSLLLELLSEVNVAYIYIKNNKEMVTVPDSMKFYFIIYKYLKYFLPEFNIDILSVRMSLVN